MDMRRSVVMSSRARCDLCLKYADAWDRFQVSFISAQDEFPLAGYCCRQCLPMLPDSVNIGGQTYVRAVRAP